MADRDEDSAPSHAVATTGSGSGRASALERLHGVEAGQYWRTRAPVAQMSRNGYRAALPGDRVYLVESLRYADDALHVVRLAPHPSEYAGLGAGAKARSHDVLVEEFYELFERADDWQAVRQAELGALQGRIADLQSEILAGPPDVPVLSAPTGLGASPGIGTLVRAAASLPALTARAEEAMAIASRHAEWVTERTRGISAAASEMAPYFEERARQATAALEETTEKVRRIRRTLVGIGLYTGEGVDCRLLVDGAQAAPGIPVTCFASMLYADEEHLVHLAEGGLDHSHAGEFAEAMADPALRDRMMTTERAIVLVQWRRERKYKAVGHTLFDLMASVEEAEADRQRFLLIRDGERVWQVFSPVTTQAIDRLFPSAADAAEAFATGFAGLDLREIGPEDLDWSRAKERHADYALTYRRLVLLLWGLQDRLGVLGPFHAGVASFLDPDFQRDNFRFVDDEAPSLTSGRPPFAEFVRRCNAAVAPGSRVLYRPGQMVGEYSTPSVFRLHEFRVRASRSDLLWEAGDGNAAVGVARRRGMDVVVGLEISSVSWPRGRGEPSERTFDTSVGLDDEYLYGTSEKYGRHRAKDGFGWLCLDDVRPDDITHYLTSRRERRGYLDYIALFVEVRAYLAADAAATAPYREATLDALREARVVARDEDAAEPIGRAMRMARIARRGAAFPPMGTEDGKAVLHAIMDNAYALLRPGDTDEGQVRKLCERLGRVPYRLTLTGKATLVLAASLRADERDDRVGPDPDVASIVVAKATDGALVKKGAVKVARLEPQGAGDQVLATFEGEAERVAAATAQPRLLTPARRRAAADLAEEGGRFLAGWANPGRLWDVALDRLARARAASTRASDVQVATVRVWAPVATVWLRPRGVEPRLLVVSVEEDGFILLARTATGGALDAIGNVYSDGYKHRDAARQRVRDARHCLLRLTVRNAVASTPRAGLRDWRARERSGPEVSAAVDGDWMTGVARVLGDYHDTEAVRAALDPFVPPEAVEALGRLVPPDWRFDAARLGTS